VITNPCMRDLYTISILDTSRAFLMKMVSDKKLYSTLVSQDRKISD